MSNSDENWNVGSGVHKYNPRMRIFDTSFAYLFCLANNKNSLYQK